MKKLTFLLFSTLVFPLTIMAQAWDDAKYKAIEASIVAPQFADAEFDITATGITTDATPKEIQTAINSTITKCSEAGGGKVIIPPGTWKTGAITLKSNVNLVVKAGATLLFAYDPFLYPLVKTRWEGLDIMNYSPCIYAYQAKNVAITGDGIIDGNGTKDTWWKWCGAAKYGYDANTLQSQSNEYAGKNTQYKQVDADGKVLSNRNTLLWMADNNIPTEERVFGIGCGMRPQLVNFYECENVLVDGVIFLRSPFWVIHPVLSKNIIVRRCKIINDGPNGDGCDPESCENVLIEKCIFNTGDDCIAIKSGRNGDGRRTPRPSKNIIIRGCTMEDGHGGVVIGSEISAGVQNVFAEDCRMDSPNLDRVLRIKTNTCRGGVTDGIYMRNVTVGQCREAVLRINLQYEPKEKSKRGFTPVVQNIYMENVTCKKSKYGILLNGLEDTVAINNISLKNCTFNGVTDKPIQKTGKVGTKLKFSKLIINDKLILAKAPYKHYSEWMTWSEMKRVRHPFYLDFTDEAIEPNGKWSYAVGIELESMLDTWRAYQNADVIKYLKEYPARMIDEDGNIKGYKQSDYILDNVRPARFILRMNRLFLGDNEVRTYGTEKAVANVFAQMQSHPRTTTGKDGRGVFWHKNIYPNQVWLDGIYMGLPFFTMIAGEMEEKDAKNVAKHVYDDVVNQIATTFEKTYDEKTGLWKHAWDENKSIFWADKTTGLSQHSWSRALGWFAMAMVEVLDELPENYERRKEVKDMLQKVMTAVVKYQDAKTGVWYDVMDVKDPKNYLESTASCMFSYVLLKGSRLGYLDTSFKQAGVKAYDGIINEFIKINNDKTISLTNCCSVSGLGPEDTPSRDGSFEYYMSEPIRDNDAKGIAPFIWASLEMERDKAETVKLGY
jgi:polygalacturonase/rhamnogalacturonyl hydrolase YesR